MTVEQRIAALEAQVKALQNKMLDIRDGRDGRDGERGPPGKDGKPVVVKADADDKQDTAKPCTWKFKTLPDGETIATPILQ